MSATTERVTYATLAAGQSEEFQRKYDEALQRVRASFGGRIRASSTARRSGAPRRSRTGARSTRAS